LNALQGWRKMVGIEAMSRPRKRFSAAKEARRRARVLAGAPPAARVIPDKRRKPPKHKNKIAEE
jgi:hypothetical protein